LINYYDILGIKPGATGNEIKAAFRMLAKRFHPDKNPQGQEEFKKILLAYETLSDPSRKYAYDLKLKYQQNAAHGTKQAGKKHYTFEEKEMRRRQYYNEHIKKYEKMTRAKTQHAELKKNYNEYKYILFATPLAVLLFLLVIHFATPSHRGTTLPQNNPPTTEVTNLKMGDSPYSSYFGNPVYDTLANQTLTVKNNTGKDVIICLFSNNKFLRCSFVRGGYYISISQLPNAFINIRYSSGYNWDPDYELKEVKLYGAFTKDLKFYESEEIELTTVNEITLINGLNQGFKEIDQKEFFRKNKLQ